MRTFIAIELPEEAKKYLEILQQEFRQKGMTLAKGFHLTLKFLGDVDGSRLEKVKEKLMEIKVNSFKLSLSNLGVFPNRHNPRVLWVGINPDECVRKLQEQVEEKLKSFNFEKDHRFHPHITLARIKFLEDKEKLLLKLKIPVEKKEIDVNSFILFKSTLTPSGPVYEAIEEFR
ncbi:RNA 2',3'-cyclic phosphodiesterase [Candidatus Woesearchaeota archaeon]|nr:RNA 2',3'-cyclic phosphodiesterase [Candidatus Woesearchaeota archaeon]